MIFIIASLIRAFILQKFKLIEGCVKKASLFLKFFNKSNSFYRNSINLQIPNYYKTY